VPLITCLLCSIKGQPHLHLLLNFIYHFYNLGHYIRYSGNYVHLFVLFAHYTTDISLRSYSSIILLHPNILSKMKLTHRDLCSIHLF
jgi:hypothetical protein